MDGPIDTATTRLMDRIVHKADFERVLASRSRLRSVHFALHHLAGAPAPRLWVRKAGPSDSCHSELSTGTAPACPQAVDDLRLQLHSQVPAGLWFGCVIPKRHAKRAVTRNLLKRQIRSAFCRLGSRLPSGLWLVRLKAPFSQQAFISAKSTLLAAAARKELETLLAQALG